MRQRMRGRLVTAILAVGLVAGVLASPSALADPEVAPPPPAPIDPAAAPAPAPVDPFAPPPVADPIGFPAPPPPADPLAPPPADPFVPPPANPLAAAQPTVIPEGTPAGQNPTPYTGEPVFAPPTFNPTNGSKVGAAKPIYINFQRPIADRAMAEQAIHISSVPPVPGRFYWTSDTQVRWRPQDFWPAGTVVNIDAGGTKSSFTVPEQLVATIDDATHQMTVVRNGKVEKT
ncbi:Ig-like domain-containing protein, partial [Mycobacterium sp. URHB0021]